MEEVAVVKNIPLYLTLIAANNAETTQIVMILLMITVLIEIILLSTATHSGYSGDQDQSGYGWDQDESQTQTPEVFNPPHSQTNQESNHYLS